MSTDVIPDELLPTLKAIDKCVRWLRQAQNLQYESAMGLVVYDVASLLEDARQHWPTITGKCVLCRQPRCAVWRSATDLAAALYHLRESRSPDS